MARPGDMYSLLWGECTLVLAQVSVYPRPCPSLVQQLLGQPWAGTHTGRFARTGLSHQPSSLAGFCSNGVSSFSVFPDSTVIWF